MTDVVELLFFDTFAHDNTEELNLDLVQFPKPVFVTEVRIIPLGARVQADFPGGVRLGATNPSQFKIEFFVNDLGKPGASTFESLGGFEYNQNGCINLNCVQEETIRKIPTDGLVLRGWYTTITLAVYGTLTNNLAEQLIQPVVNPALPTQPNTIADAQQIVAGTTIDTEWPQENANIEYNQPATNYQQQYSQPETYSNEYNEYYGETPKDPRGYHHPPEGDWDSKVRPSRSSENDRDREHSRSDRERDREKNYQRSHSRDRHVSRERDRDWDWERDNRPRERYKHDDGGYRRPYERDERKRPRTPPMQSPKRPHTPQSSIKDTSPPAPDVEAESSTEKQKQSQQEVLPQKSPSKESPTPPAAASSTTNAAPASAPADEPIQTIDVEEFEPILSDEEIVDEEMDYDYSAYTNNDDLIKQFIPGASNLRKFNKTAQFTVVGNQIDVDERLKFTIGIVDDHFKSCIEKYTLDNFEQQKSEMKEEFIHVAEKLITLFESVEQFCETVKLYVAIKNLNVSLLQSKDDEELVIQVKTIVQTVMEWLKIALDYKMANLQEQPTYKIRQIKCGARLADWCFNSAEFVKLLIESKYKVHQVLFKLYEEQYMAESIKLMMLKALDTYLLHKFAIENFLYGDISDGKENGYHNSVSSNGYQVLIEKLRLDPLVRLKFAINSILKKLNIYEIFQKLQEILIKCRNSNDLNETDINFITNGLDQILNCHYNGQFALSQPKRFLPVQAQFEIVRNDTKNILVEYFKMFDALQCFFLLLTLPSTYNLPRIKTPIFEILSELMKSLDGIEYLSDKCETTNGLVRLLLRTDVEMQYTIQDYIEIKSHNLGLEMAYKVEAWYCVQNLMELARKYNRDYDALEVIDQLHAFFCLTFTNIGRISCAQVLCMKNNINCLLQFLGDVCGNLNINNKEKMDNLIAKIKKSPAIGYIIDLLTFAVTITPDIPFLENNMKQLCHLIDQQDIFADDIGTLAKINEIKQYLTPLESKTEWRYTNISHFVKVLNKQLDNVTTLPLQLICCLRMIHFWGISPHLNNQYQQVEDVALNHYVEFKYKHVILYLYSLDGMPLLIKILQKLCEYYEQPALHTATFASHQGFLLINIIGPCIDLVKQMLTYVIKWQNTHYKDLTAVPILLQTYNLLNSFPNTCGSYLHAQQICKNIIETLLVYTQPISDEIDENDSLNKTLWSQMCGEVIKFIMSAPHTFISGLLVLSELLPLPLPIQSNEELTKEEVTWAVNLRKLWSAHLHPHCNAIQEMIGRLCLTSHSQLLNLLRRVCVQLADLAANTSIMIAKGIMDVVHKALWPNEESKIGVCNNHIARLLNFFACLVTHNTLKCTVLHLLGNSANKSDEKNLIQLFAQVLKVNNLTTSSHVQAQECILSIIQSFCDTEITLMQNNNSELYLANALPTKETLLVFIGIVLDYIQVENSFVSYLPAVRTLLLLTEHDYGFYHLREQLLKRQNVFGTLLNKLSKNFSKDNAECLSTLNTMVEFVRVCVSIDDVVDGGAMRTMKLSQKEVCAIVGWKGNVVVEEGGEGGVSSEEKHAFLQLEEILKKLKDEEVTFDSLLESVSSMVKLLSENEPGENDAEYSEPILCEPETLLAQFSARMIFSVGNVCDERLTIQYWQSIPAEEFESENVVSDLNEVVKQYLPQDFNIVKEIEKLCRICSIESSSEKEKRGESDQKIKMKKPFITPIRSRGFPRTIQQRSDLFRSRPPNTSRPPSLHVDDFVALETCGAQPTGPTGYNKFSRELLASTRIARGSRGRSFVASERSVQCRQMSWWGPNLARGPYQ